MLQCPPFSLPRERSRLLCAFSASSSPHDLKQILARAVISGLFAEPFVSARIVAAFAASDLSLAQLAFDASPRRSAFSYSSMIRAHSAGPTPSNSFILFSRMLHSGFYPDRFVFPFLLRASARSLWPPSFIHAFSLRHGCDGDTHVATSLLHAYACSGLFGCARKVFDEMPQRTVVTWSAIISCCARSQQQQQEDGLFLFTQMISTGVRPNADTFIVALSCCAGLGFLAHGKALHSLSIRLLSQLFEVATALINMYARCGSLNCALKVFNGIQKKDSSTWTAMIGGLAMHGCGERAVAFFDKMVEEKERHLQPDGLTFTAVLHACSLSGLVQTGMRIFNDMKAVYCIEPRMEHYGVMVDMLGRAGRFEEAERVVASMPFEPNRIVLGSLLHACLVRGELAYAERLERSFLGLRFGVEEEEENDDFGGGFFVGLSNLYAGACRWEKVGRVREEMVERGVRKNSAFSLLEVDGKVDF
ncbi:pentatricopeptide repeat-containing protein At1g59720, chloroplastic/mitochondrial [Dendrobium catenatum]|uniref:Pentatricopeptide repeat-containing protein n=1 Tax=Dendrobium catenatum TaxID=906689 RepID=A0A2I0VJ25_9ASPA|nr:pentatricopeptide repeat-containing protein At1g59720, chloroplastic/mitochondrial [Dendrobium catenatum]PKU63419.1 Pentatricopeptide repeat-containing protein [Dendrobium catenatum]